MNEETSNDKTLDFIQYILSSCSEIVLFLYFFSDHISYFGKFNLYKNKQISAWSGWFNDFSWFIQELIDFLNNFIKLVR